MTSSRAKALAGYNATWGPGFATFQYPNANRASTIWYHDHALGMTRLNVYAGPAGFYIVRGGPAGDGAVLDRRTGMQAKLPGPAPKENDPFPTNKKYYEIPIAIQDRAFNEDGSLFYPDTRALFDGIVGPYIPAGDFSPIWNPEFFGNTIMVNGNTWPTLDVERRRYRFRFLNGCQSRFLILDFNQIPGVKVWQIGNEGGFLDAKAVDITGAHGNRLLMGLAERADMIVDFSGVPVGPHILANGGPDEPFKGFNLDGTLTDGEGGVLPPADPLTTGQIMQFNVLPKVVTDGTTPPEFLMLPAITRLPAETVTRPLALIEMMGTGTDPDGDVDGPTEAMLGTVEGGMAVDKMWMEPVTENPNVGDTEVWEFYNTTGDAHPMHVHEVVFEVVNRQAITFTEDMGHIMDDHAGRRNQAAAGEMGGGLQGHRDRLSGEVTRIRAQFNSPGQFTWHCHIVEHEDNEMMRPYRIGPVQPGSPDDESMA